MPWASAVGRVARYRGICASHLKPYTGVRRVTDLESELAAAVADSGAPVLAVIPEGPYVQVSAVH